MKKILFVSTLANPHVNMMNRYPPKLEFSENPYYWKFDPDYNIGS